MLDDNKLPQNSGLHVLLAELFGVVLLRKSLYPHHRQTLPRIWGARLKLKRKDQRSFLNFNAYVLLLGKETRANGIPLHIAGTSWTELRRGPSAVGMTFTVLKF